MCMSPVCSAAFQMLRFFIELGKKAVRETISAVSWEQLTRNHQCPGVRKSNVAAMSKLVLKYRLKRCISRRF